MSSMNTDTLLVGLSYLEAVMKNDTEMKNVILDSYNKDEIIRAVTSVAMAMTGIVARQDSSEDAYIKTIEHARRTVLNI